MSARILVAAALAAISFNALADSAPAFIKGDAPFSSSLSAADVRKEAADALRKGWIPQGEAGTPGGVMVRAGAAKSRDQVRAELIEALRMGRLPAGEAYNG